MDFTFLSKMDWADAFLAVALFFITFFLLIITFFLLKELTSTSDTTTATAFVAFGAGLAVRIGAVDGPNLVVDQAIPTIACHRAYSSLFLFWRGSILARGFLDALPILFNCAFFAGQSGIRTAFATSESKK